MSRNKNAPVKISFPHGLIKQVDCLVGKNGRASFLRATVEAAIESNVRQFSSPHDWRETLEEDYCSIIESQAATHPRFARDGEEDDDCPF